MLVRILTIPKSDGNFRFGGGAPQTFHEVDWFRDDPSIDGAPSFATAEGRAEIEQWLRKKNYFDPAKAYLVLHPANPFTINYEAP